MELLAPAGNVESLKAAVFNGADAVYLGLDLFNARAKAENFTIENIKEHIDFCHLFGVKVYIAFNTCVKDAELPALERYVTAAADAGADAFIVTDLGALEIFAGSKVPLHASTQMGIHNAEGAKMAKELGFSRVVLARECTTEDIREVKKVGLEVEIFAHGALCVSFSGGCLMSSFMSGDSGNRGRCNQPCRLKYSCNGRSGYLLSAADLCLLDRVEELRAAGADSLKIEGRLKTAYYCAEVVSSYRAAIDGKLTGREMPRLLRAFNRGGFTRGYGVDDTPRLMSVKIQNNVGELSGVVRAVGRGYIDAELKAEIALGDGVKIVRGGEEVGGFTVEKAQRAGKLLRISCKSGSLREGDLIFVTFDRARAEELKKVKKSLPVRLTLTAAAGERVKLKASVSGVEAEVKGEVCEAAKSDQEQACADVLKKGYGEFTPAATSIDIKDAFVPKSLLNEMRRRVYAELCEKLLDNYNKNILKRNSGACVPALGKERSKGALQVLGYVMCSSVEAMKAAKDAGYAAILQINDYMSKELDIIMKNKIFDNNIGNFLAVAVVLRSADMKVLRAFLRKHAEKFEGFYCENLGAIALALEFDKKIVGGIGLNIYNSKCINVLPLDDYVASCELSAKELSFLPSPVIYAFGKVRLMTLTHCPVKLNFGGDCGKCRYDGGLEYADRFGVYPLRRTRVANCYFALYNPAVTDISAKMRLAPSFAGKIFLDMIEYGADEVSYTLARYKNGGAPEGAVTSGHLFRGVK